MILLYHSVLETKPGQTFVQLLNSLDSRDVLTARHLFGQLSQQSWPTASCWRGFVQQQARFSTTLRRTQGLRILA
jgi:hypothetical protein